MPQISVKINSILGGMSPTQYFGQEGQYLAGIGIDPDYPITSSAVRTSGAIVPTVYEKFSGSNVTGYPIAIINVPKTTLTYAILSNGRIVSYNSALGSESLVGTVSGGVARGAWYYNNYIYIATGTDLSRLGPLDGAAALTDGVWTGATLGSQTALTDTTYPTIRGLMMPNHWGCIHSDGSSYFLDFKNGQGMVHRVNTKKVTSEGDTNGTVVPSLYNVLDLPFGFYPVCISSYSTDLAILAIQTTDSTVNQGKAALFLWDPTNTDTFYRGPVYLPDPLATALLYINGILYVFSGNAQNGFRISRYAGGDSLTDVLFMEEGAPPFAGAIDALGGRLVWGGYTTYPTATASVFALGSKNSALPQGLHNVVRSTSTGANQNVTALKYVLQSSSITPQLVVGWGDDSAKGLDKKSTSATYASVYRSDIVTIGKKFTVIKVRIPLGDTVAANMSITPKIYFDDGSSSSTLTEINNTNFSGKRAIIYKAPDLNAIGGTNNFFVELSFAGTVALPVTLPIELEVTLYDDETT